MSVIDKARELGDEIANSAELIAMRNAEAAMLQDSEAQKIIQEFQDKQKALYMIQSQGHQLTDSQKKEVELLENKMLANPLIRDYFQAQQNFEKVLEEINQIIGTAIAGQGNSCSDECCSSCSGCSV